MNELGAVFASGKPVVTISCSGSQAFPFDIRHRTIIEYSRDSSSDFEKLKIEITKRLVSILKTETEVQETVTARAGFTDLATELALLSLERQGLAQSYDDQTGNLNGDSITAYRLTTDGEDWLLTNQDRAVEGVAETLAG